MHEEIANPPCSIGPRIRSPAPALCTATPARWTPPRNFTPWGWGPQHLPSQVTGMEYNNQMQAEVLANHRDYGYEFKFHITSNNISWGDCGWVSRTFFLGWRFHKVSRWIQFCAIPQEKWDHSLKAPNKTYAVMWFFLKWQLNQRFQWGPLFDWGFNTLAFYCPVTCGCMATPITDDLTDQDRRCPLNSLSGCGSGSLPDDGSSGSAPTRSGGSSGPSSGFGGPSGPR